MVTEDLRQRQANAQASAASCLRCRALGLALPGFLAGALSIILWALLA